MFFNLIGMSFKESSVNCLLRVAAVGRSVAQGLAVMQKYGGKGLIIRFFS